MKLIDIINEETKRLYYETHVDYRTYTPDGEDIFTGWCVVNKAGDIICSDLDTYSILDEFNEYRVVLDGQGIPYLECYYESEWL